MIDVIERVDGPDAEVLELRNDTLVVHDLAERVRELAGGRCLLGLVDRLANAVTEAGPLRDADFPNGTHVGSSISWWPAEPGWGGVWG